MWASAPPPLKGRWREKREAISRRSSIAPGHCAERVDAYAARLLAELAAIVLGALHSDRFGLHAAKRETNGAHFVCERENTSVLGRHLEDRNARFNDLRRLSARLRCRCLAQSQHANV